MLLPTRKQNFSSFQQHIAKRGKNLGHHNVWEIDTIQPCVTGLPLQLKDWRRYESNLEAPRRQ
jgi:hypothetical protein